MSLRAAFPIALARRPTLLARLAVFFGSAAFAPAFLPAAEIPAYFGVAMTRFVPGVPDDWAYTLAVTRGDESSVERFDPARASGQKWTLATHNGHPATDREIDRYQRYRETNAATAGARAVFSRGDIDFGSAELIHETATHATIRCRFRSDATEPILSHLSLTLVVAKDPALVEKATLLLLAPYSPVIGMKINELEVATVYAPATVDLPALPRSSVSRFRGRALLVWSVEEDSRVTYSDFYRSIPSARHPVRE